ncbi:hypothetical protein [Streptomyces sp. NPDC001816]|uniref:hypothetical protein n=1 Tax=Streptomyces sp. NPDC001816 TaxID=3364612 RepID=UPI0036BA7F30
MSTTRRGILGAALAGPLLGQFAGGSSHAAAAGSLGTISDGWIEIRWTPQAQALLDKFQAVVEAVAPAQLVTDARGSALRFPVRSGEGDPSMTNLAGAHGDGALDGGFAVRTSNGHFRVTELRGGMQDGLVSGKALVNGMEVGHSAAYRPALAEGRLTNNSVPLGQPMKIRLADVPLRPTPRSWTPTPPRSARRRRSPPTRFWPT